MKTHLPIPCENTAESLREEIARTTQEVVFWKRQETLRSDPKARMTAVASRCIWEGYLAGLKVRLETLP